MARERTAWSPREHDAEDRDVPADVLIPPRRGGRQVIVGAFVLVGIISILIALFTLTDPALFRGRYIITTVVPDAGGIRRGDPVEMRGVNIGRVSKFTMVPNGVRVRLELEGEYSVPVDSRVNLESSGLLGGMVAQIVPGHSSQMIGGGGTLPGVSATGGGLGDVGALTGKADVLLGRAQELLSPSNVSNLGATTAELRAGTTQLRQLLATTRDLVVQERASLSATLTNMRDVSAGLARAQPGEQVTRLTARMDTLTAALGTSADRLSAASASLQSVLGRMERGEGTLGKLSKDEALYDNMTAAAANLNLLVEDIRQNPKKYINVKVF